MFHRVREWIKNLSGNKMAILGVSLSIILAGSGYLFKIYFFSLDPIHKISESKIKLVENGETKIADSSRVSDDFINLITYGRDLQTSGDNIQAEKIIYKALKQAQSEGNQRYIAIAKDEIGNIQQRQGRLDNALTAYKDSLTIRKKLAKQDPTNTKWQRGLSVSYNKIGVIQQAQGQFDNALIAYENSLSIRKKNSGAKPDQYAISGRSCNCIYNNCRD